MNSTEYADEVSVESCKPFGRAYVEPTCFLTDAELIERYSAGDARAFDLLFCRYEKAVYKLAFRLTKNHDDAMEIASETFVLISRHLRTVQKAITLPAWINRIVVNVFLNARR